jgi:hypothetical protein
MFYKIRVNGDFGMCRMDFILRMGKGRLSLNLLQRF